MSLSNDAHFAMGYDCNIGRIYYKDREFVCMTMSRQSYLPFATTKLSHMAEYIFELLKNTNSEVNFQLNYPNTFSKRKISKVNQLLKINVCTIQILIRWLTLLL